jgi:peptidoglycan/LPS O-acetylase OafA/YrhL
MSEARSAVKMVQRYSQLDALRGIAAVTVMLHHFRNVWADFGLKSKWLNVFAPITEGHAAVMLFFVLSGFVLSLPLIKGSAQPYPVYLLRRVLRIYGPFLCALALAVAGAAIWHGHINDGYFTNLTWSHSVSWRLVLQHVVMLGNYDDAQFNTAFWSLIVEMRISIIFPLLFIIFSRLKPAAALSGALLISLAAAFFHHMFPGSKTYLRTITYIDVFVVGIVLACNIANVSAWYRQFAPKGRMLIGLGTFCLYAAGIHFTMTGRSWFPREVLISAGAAGYMVIALNEERVSAFLKTRIPQYLGKISYSLYLTHATVLFAMAHLFGRRGGAGIQLVGYLAVSILTAHVFYMLAEKPFHELTKMVKLRVVNNPIDKVTVTA